MNSKTLDMLHQKRISTTSWTARDGGEGAQSFQAGHLILSWETYDQGPSLTEVSSSFTK